MRTAPNINEELRWLDDAINNKFIPSFTENKLCGNDERLLLKLPTKLGGMDFTTNKRACIINSTRRKDLQN